MTIRKHLLAWLNLVPALFLVSQCFSNPTAWAQGGITFIGTVRNAVTEFPISGATVGVVSQDVDESAETAEDGTYFLPLIGAQQGTYTFTISAVGFQTETTTFTVLATGQQTANFFLEPLGDGEVADEQGAEAEPDSDGDALVEEPAEEIAEDQTDGEDEVDPGGEIEPGELDQAEESPESAEEAEPDEGEQIDDTPAKGTLTGTVVRANNSAPIDRATVTAVSQVDSGTDQSDPDGTYSIELLPGTYVVTCSKDGFNIATELEVEINSNQETTVGFGLTQSSTDGTGGQNTSLPVSCSGSVTLGTSSSLSQTLHSLRDLRDELVTSGRAGSGIIGMYYSR